MAPEKKIVFLHRLENGDNMYSLEYDHLFFLCNLFDETEKGTLIVQLIGIEKMKGMVEINLFDTKKMWLKKGGAISVQRIKVDGQDVFITFENIPFGEYAFICYHDVNGNDKMDKNMFGIPKEPYALSQEPRSKMRKPKFKEMKFMFNEKESIRKSKFRVF